MMLARVSENGFGYGMKCLVFSVLRNQGRKMQRKFKFKKEEKIKIWILLASFLFSSGFTLHGYRQRVEPAYILFYGSAFCIILFSCWAAYSIGFLKRLFFHEFVKRLAWIILLLPVVEIGYAVSKHMPTHLSTNVKPTYSYREAKGNPRAFSKWWEHLCNEWLKVRHSVEMPDPDNILPPLPIPNSSTTFFSKRIEINSHGFRGKEFNFDKQDNYRIVAIGESTTWGVMLKKDDRSWPEVLENLINSQLRCERPIEVINAGVRAYSLEDNIYRLNRDILPLNPDMVISYHGYMGFRFIDESMPDIRVVTPPPFLRRRPSSLLAKLEFKIRLWDFKRKRFKQQSLPKFKEDVCNSKYAKLYRRLVSIAQNNAFKLVLLRFNMAVNESSPEDVINFYSGPFPRIRSQIIVNSLHTHILEQIAREEEEVLYIDTSHKLDGYHDKFMDVCHFTQEGRNQLAKNIFTGIKNYLLQEKTLNCR